MNHKKILLFLLTLMFYTNVVATEDQWTWTLRRSGPERLNAVAAGNGMFVVVGDSGAILTSPDGIEWTRRNSNTLHGLHAVIWGDEMFVAGGDSGTIITSGDGVEWRVKHSGGRGAISSIVLGNERYIAIANRGLYYAARFPVFTSEDGIRWVEHPEIFLNVGTSNFRNFVYGNGLFMAAILNCGSTPISTDGINWQENSESTRLSLNEATWYNCIYKPGEPVIMPGCTYVRSMVYGNGIFLLLGWDGLARYEKSHNGWEILDLRCWNRGVIGHRLFYDGARFIMFAGDGIYSTEEGESFERISTDITIPISIAYNGNVYVTVNGVEIGTLSQDIASVINSGRTTKFTPDLVIHQSGKLLKITIPKSIRPEIGLFNVAGKRQRIKPVFSSDGSISVPLANFAAGTYILRINDGKNSWQRRVILK